LAQHEKENEKEAKLDRRREKYQSAVAKVKGLFSKKDNSIEEDLENLGDEFDHLFDEGCGDYTADVQVVNLEPEEEEAEIVIKVNEGLFDKRNKLLFERLTKWSSK
jgi:hypothetical protein